MISAFERLFPSRCPHCKSIDFRCVGPRNQLGKIFRKFLQSCVCSMCGHGFYLIRSPFAVASVD
jgi:hypothetical protein